MSPLGKHLLSVCDNNLVLDLSQVAFSWYVGKGYGGIVAVALHLGLSIKGGS